MGWRKSRAVFQVCYRVTFLTGAPLNFLSTRSHVNWLGIYLLVRDCKGICTRKLRGATFKKVTLYVQALLTLPIEIFQDMDVWWHPTYINLQVVHVLMHCIT